MSTVGDVNRNGQRLIEKTDHPGNDHRQYVWVLQCTRPECGHLYGANGTDFFQRKCPVCQGGAAGLPVPSFGKKIGNGQSIGRALPDWTLRPSPPRTPLDGRFCRIELLNAERHAAQLFEANAHDRDGRNWTYLGYGPFDSFEPYRAWVEKVAATADPLFHAIIDLTTGKAVGVASLMRIDPDNGVIEVGHINYSPLLQRKAAATEAMFLLMRRVFDELGYRRYEWKCDSLNAPSRAAAVRLGFTYEGLFRQALVYKGRNRDTTWYSIVDGEWPALKRAYEAWLALDNFDAGGGQRRRLPDLIAEARASR